MWTTHVMWFISLIEKKSKLSSYTVSPTACPQHRWPAIYADTARLLAPDGLIVAMISELDAGYEAFARIDAAEFSRLTGWAWNQPAVESDNHAPSQQAAAATVTRHFVRAPGQAR
tara:strand:+ start:123 stop:467 length:345 start_codon:yes stop_codon:yes gene_type:complete